MTQHKPTSLHVQAYNFINLCRDDIVPFWANHGVDRKQGGFYERLHFDGTPDLRTARRLRVTSRQIYAFAHASVAGWVDERALVNWAVDYLVSTPRHRDGAPGFVHLLDADGSICDARRDLYDHAFHILALSWAYRATGDAQILALAIETLAFVDEAMGCVKGGWQEGDATALPRRQNPHMHMFEALLALFEASGDTAYLNRAGDIAVLLAERFTDQKTGLLFEDFDDDLVPIRPARIEPGHMAEWCWLLHKYAALKAEAPLDIALILGKHADALAPKGQGFLLDGFDENLNILTPSRRLWGQTEWLKSMLVRFEAGNEGMAVMADALLGRMHSSYFETTTPGLWMDKFDLQGVPLANHVPASIVYHLASAATEVERVMTSMEESAS
ncbi:MAG: mannose-6-phosphate isomerase [Robiginitomaculum sp.]|nr:MAG: mannose-6-phosphate isomerase [Robiginitomaculum sp.]